MPLVRLPTVIGATASPNRNPLPVTPPLLEVQLASYRLTIAPPLLPAVKVKMMLVLPGVAVVIVGAAGAEEPDIGVKLLDANDCALGPILLLAVTLQVYRKLGVDNPSTVTEVAGSG